MGIGRIIGVIADGTLYRGEMRCVVVVGIGKIEAGEVPRLEMRRSGTDKCGAVARSHGFGEREARGAQEKEKFAGPEQDIQQTAALEIGQVVRMEADVESLARAFLDKGAHGRGVEGFRAEPAAARIQALQLVVAAQKKVIQAKILAIQLSNRGARTRSHTAVSFSMH
jgi:hypothetical protein